MTNLVVVKKLNTGDHFMIGSIRYTLIVVDPDDSTKYKCLCVDKANSASITKIGIDDVPKSFNQYVYSIDNPEAFDSGTVIFAYKRTVEQINEIQAIVNCCTSKSISFMYRNDGGAHVTQSLTGKQINDSGIVIMAYEKPVIE